MQLEEAQNLISHPSLDGEGVWADLGCGTGLFTQALASFLAAGSTIYAVDKNAGALQQVPEAFGQASIVRHQADFAKNHLSLPHLDGILMANSLHFVRNKGKFLQEISQYLKSQATLLVVEYDRSLPNPWVPYPLRYAKLAPLMEKAGFGKVQKVGERESRYGRKMYCAKGILGY